MKKHLLIAFLSVALSCWCTTLLQAQNLVLNGDFSQYTSCPQGISEFSLAVDWITTTTPGSDTCSTPDLYEACSSDIGGTNVPNALLGYHTARTGTSFAGIILGDGLPGCIPTGDNYREYIEGTLSTPMVAGQKYLVLFYASLAEDVMWGSNSLGVYLTNTQYTHDACPNPLIPETPQLEMCGPAIMDTVNWIPVEWIYTAVGGEQYFTIGNFKDDANTNRVVHNCGSFNPYIYYYIDDVSVTPVGPNVCAFAVLTDSTNTTCGTNNGTVAITALGCPSPFTYAWSNSATTATVPNLANGSYTVTVTDSTNCHVTASVSVNSNPLRVSLSAANPGCNSSTGSATITATSGTGPYTYLWSNGSTTQAVSNLQAGSYYVTVNGATGCVAHDSVSLLGSSGMTITPAITGATCGNTNGSATAAITGGTPPYTYAWSNGQTTQTATGLTAGTYTVTVAGDTSSGPFFTENFASGGSTWTLNTPAAGPNGDSHNQWIVNSDNNCTCWGGNYLHITVNSTNTTCLECDFMAGQCTYMELASTFGEGDFTTDELAISPVISTIGKSNIVLTYDMMVDGTPGADYGLVDLSNDGGTTWTALPAQYVDSFNCTKASVAIPINYQNIANFRFAFEWINAAGSLSATGNPPGFVIDSIALTSGSSSCPAIATVTIPSTGGITATTTSTAPSCGHNNGTATATVTGSGTFTYAWNNGATTQTISNLGAGLYNVTVSTGAGCTATAAATLSIGSGTISALANGTNASCGNSNGIVTASVSPAGNYGYVWSNGATTATINNLPSGTYTVTVSTTGGCSVTATSTISGSSGIVLSAFGGRSGCTSSGTASVSVTSGTGPYTYLWSNGATTANLTDLSASNYIVTVTGAAGCTATASATVISAGTGVTLNAIAAGTGCGANSGSVNVVVSTGNGPFNYIWSNGGTTDTISNLAGGTYTVTVTSNDGCTATAAAAVTVSGILSLTTNVTGTTCGNTNGGASVTATGGPFTYIWSNGATTSSISNVASGTYSVTVQGGSCSATASAIVNPSGSTVSIQASASAICQGDTSQICAPAGYHSYIWNIGDTSQCVNATAAGNYYVTVTDNGNCTAISNHVAITVNTPVAVTITVHGDTLKASSATSYQWYLAGTAISGATSSIYVATQDGNYTVKGTDGNGCTSTSNSELIKNILGVAQVNAAANIKVYPNPLSTGSWHVDVSSEWVGSECDVMDATGRVIYSTQLKSAQSEINLNVAQGVYLLRINSGPKNYTVKLVKL